MVSGAVDLLELPEQKGPELSPLPGGQILVPGAQLYWSELEAQSEAETWLCSRLRAGGRVTPGLAA